MARSISTFGDYLALAATNPDILRSPYSHEEKRILGYMGWYKGQLAANWPNRSGVEPLISVILPTYNRAWILRRAILSVLTQTMRNLELIVVDDGSSDDTQQVVGGFTDQRLRYLRSSRNRGPAHARNMGLDSARGDYIAYMDSDDWWDGDFLKVMVERATATGHEFVYSAQRVIRPSLTVPGPHRAEVVRFSPYNASLLENVNYISQIAVLHSRAVGREVGGFDSHFRKYVDWEFFLRLSKKAVPLGVPVILSHYDQGGSDTVSNSSEKETWLQKVWATQGGPEINLRTLSRKYGGDDIPRDLQRREYAGASQVRITPRKRPAGSDAERGAAPASFRRPIAIVIPSFEVAEYLRLTLASIIEYTPEGVYDLIVVDNGSGSDVQAVLDEFSHSHGITTIRNSENVGFSEAVNQGIEAAGSESDIVVLNNDTLVTEGWLEELHLAAHRYEDAGIVAPRQVLLPHDRTIKIHVPSALPANECDTNISAHHSNLIDPYFDPEHAVFELKYAPFFCVYIRREAIDECGSLDSRMGVHYQSDWVYCDAVRRYAARRILYTPDAKVYHFNGRATKQLRARSPEAIELMQARR